MTPYFARFWIVMFVTAAIIFGCRLAGAQDADESQAPKEESHVGVDAVHPAGPDMFAHGRLPVLYFGTRACGEFVIWLVYEDGYMSRVDKSHKPKDWAGFLKDLEGAKVPSDVAVIECTAAAL